MSLRLRASTVTALLAAGLAWGCATDGNRRADRDDSPPALLAADEARNRLHASVDRAFRRSEGRDSYEVTVRYNPPRCDAPVFEVRAHGRWTRAWLDGPSEMNRRIRKFRTEMEENSGATGPKRLEISGRFTDERRADTGVAYPVFWVVAVEPDS